MLRKSEDEEMLKKKMIVVLCSVLTISLIACSGKAAGKKVPLDADEEEMIELISEDIHTIADQEYAQTVNELLYHTEEYSGQIYQLEGTYSVEDEKTSISRTLVNGKEKTICSLPLKYVQKEITSGSWVRVTGVINQDEDGKTVLEVVAIEALGKQGEAELSWDGSLEHQH